MMQLTNLNSIRRSCRRFHLAATRVVQHGPCGRLLTITAASRHSGVRGGHLRNLRRFTITFEQAAEWYADGTLPLHRLYER